jgi:hypothetical protein
VAIQTHPDALGDRAGHRLFWMRPDSAQPAGRAILPAHPAWDASVVVGSHRKCGIVFADDPSVALRHVLLRSIALPSGSVALRVIDLHTDLGFMLMEGTHQTSIFAEGPIAVAIGEHALVALPASAPIDGRKDERFPTDLPPPETSTPLEVENQLAQMAQALGPYRANARPLGWSRITLMPRLLMMGESHLGHAGGPSWTITLEREGRSAMQTVSEEDLAAGVVIGRSEKCHSEELRRITDDNTSRTHVLILREGEHICAYDLASTHGLFQAGAQARRIVLGATATFQLGRGSRSVRVLWQRAS